MENFRAEERYAGGLLLEGRPSGINSMSVGADGSSGDREERNHRR
jgi:hypothetical protein